LSEKLINFRWDEEKYQKIKELALKERKDIKDLIGGLLEEYIKEHGDGNPQYMITQFEDPNFMACPAFYRDGDTWKNYLSKASNEELENVKNQIIMIDKKLAMFL